MTDTNEEGRTVQLETADDVAVELTTYEAEIQAGGTRVRLTDDQAAELGELLARWAHDGNPRDRGRLVKLPPVRHGLLTDDLTDDDWDLQFMARMLDQLDRHVGRKADPVVKMLQVSEAVGELLSSYWRVVEAAGRCHDADVTPVVARDVGGRAWDLAGRARRIEDDIRRGVI